MITTNETAIRVTYNVCRPNVIRVSFLRQAPKKLMFARPNADAKSRNVALANQGVFCLEKNRSCAFPSKKSVPSRNQFAAHTGRNLSIASNTGSSSSLGVLGKRSAAAKGSSSSLGVALQETENHQGNANNVTARAVNTASRNQFASTIIASNTGRNQFAGAGRGAPANSPYSRNIWLALTQTASATYCCVGRRQRTAGNSTKARSGEMNGWIPNWDPKK